MTAVTEGLVEARDRARQAESRTDLAQAMLSLEQRINRSAGSPHHIRCPIPQVRGC